MNDFVPWILYGLGVLQAVALVMMANARADRIKKDDVVNDKLDGIGHTMAGISVTLTRHDERIKTLFGRLGVERREWPRDSGFPMAGE